LKEKLQYVFLITMNYVQKQKHSTHEHVQAKHFVEDMGDKKNV
jgi:hypothetical protein